MKSASLPVMLTQIIVASAYVNALNRLYAVLQNGNKAEGKSPPLLPDEAKHSTTKRLKRRGRGL